MPAVRIKDHWNEQRLFDQRALVAPRSWRSPPSA